MEFLWISLSIFLAVCSSSRGVEIVAIAHRCSCSQSGGAEALAQEDGCGVVLRVLLRESNVKIKVVYLDRALNISG